jgi:DNA ligase-4
MTWPWVKLKVSTGSGVTRFPVLIIEQEDYIPNLGDCVDLVVLGAGWDLDRARELRVDTSVYTTFYIGTLTNTERVRSRTETPHFEILFRASYGPSRDELEIYNEKIRHGRWGSKPYDRDDPSKRVSTLKVLMIMY